MFLCVSPIACSLRNKVYISDSVKRDKIKHSMSDVSDALGAVTQDICQLYLHCFAAQQKMEGVYGKLCKKYPDMAKQSEKKLEEVHENWSRLEDLANAR